MKYEIHYQGEDYKDSFIVEGDDLELLRKDVYAEVARRGWNQKYVFALKLED